LLLHALITLLAIAFALPAGAQYILYQWWPKVAEDANLLLATEIGLAAALALLFNVSIISPGCACRAKRSRSSSTSMNRSGRWRCSGNSSGSSTATAVSRSSSELIYRDEEGREVGRAKLGDCRPRPESPALLASWNAHFGEEAHGQGALQTGN